MNWKVIGTLAVAGIIMGFASVAGFTEGIELFLWIVIALFSGWWIGKNVVTRQFLHGLMVGLLDGILNSIVQASLFSTYIHNNESAAKGFSQIPGGITGEVFVLLFGPVIGIVYGAVVGLFSILAVKMKRKSAA